MTARRSSPLLQLLLAVLLATFLSPGFAWQAVASHSALAHADLAAGADDGRHHDDADRHHHDHDETAHGDIGHLLSHLPAVMSDATPMLSETAGDNAYPPRRPTFPHADPEPPFKPPRSLLFA